MPLTKRNGLIGLSILAIAVATPIIAQQPQIALGTKDATNAGGG